MAEPTAPRNGYEPRTYGPERRALFDLQRRMSAAETAIEEGGGGGPGPSVPLGYVHTQATASVLWTIPHGLTFRPNVAIVDSAGDEVEGDVKYVSATTITVSFSAPFTGYAYLS